ncbi:hypothetical protein ACFL27_27880 [candidate division CSSED10-310 bacterium]|uniref:DUF3471 domain-containing protein n=1 Tax=candidate division CSSED10-310 bacterium TaxID=2855610 RepID=A0ABV6Z6R6_UNCC1
MILKIRHNLLINLTLLLIFSMLLCFTSCSKTEQKTEQQTVKKVIPPASSNLQKQSNETGAAETKVMQIDEATTYSAGALPPGFPTDILPLYPNGKVDRAAVSDGEGTLLQVTPDSQDEVLKYYKNLYGQKGYKTDTPMTLFGKMMLGFKKSDSVISMTLQKRDDGQTFFSLANDKK